MPDINLFRETKHFLQNFRIPDPQFGLKRGP